MAYSKEYTYQLIKIWSTPKKISTTCCKKCQKSPNQETGLGNRGRLKSLNETKLVINEHEWPLNHLGSIWHHSEPLEVPSSPNQFLGLDFFCHFIQQNGSNSKFNVFRPEVSWDVFKTFNYVYSKVRYLIKSWERLPKCLLNNIFFQQVAKSIL